MPLARMRPLRVSDPSFRQSPIKPANTPTMPTNVRFQNIVMRPRAQELMDTAIHHLKNCRVEKLDFQAAEDIFDGIPALSSQTHGVRPDILHLYHHVTLAIARFILGVDRILIVCGKFSLK